MYMFATHIATRRTEIRSMDGTIYVQYPPGLFETWQIRPDHSLFERTLTTAQERALYASDKTTPIDLGETWR